MKRVTAFVGSARKKHTYRSVHRFLDRLHSLGDVESEIVVLSAFNLKTCRGCGCSSTSSFASFSASKSQAWSWPVTYSTTSAGLTPAFAAIRLKMSTESRVLWNRPPSWRHCGDGGGLET